MAVFIPFLMKGDLMIEITADFENIIGKIKPVHGFNNCARRTPYGELLPAFRALQPPFARLHDACYPYGGGHYVDIPNVFPDFGADTECEESYDFTLTDLYLKALHDAGIAIFYRLGVAIEHAPKKYHIHPPENPEKWAAVCEHIVRHYNEGWANGYHWNIEYWEIWNEPDGLDPKVEPFGPPNWTGTAQEYYRLYSITASRLKRHFPAIKVGGYSSCYILGANVAGIWTPGQTEFFTGFLDYITASDTKAPLDFFTWHGYIGKGSLRKIQAESEFIKQTLDRYGFTETEKIDAEWNCNICDIQTDDVRTQYYINMRNCKGASHASGALYEMQRNPVDSAMYYDAQLWLEYGGLFEVPSLEPSKTYYAFKQFGELYTLGNAVASTREDTIFSCAATGEYDMLAISNIGDTATDISVLLQNAHGEKAVVYMLDSAHNLEPVGDFDASGTINLIMPAYSFVSIKIS